MDVDTFGNTKGAASSGDIVMGDDEEGGEGGEGGAKERDPFGTLLVQSPLRRKTLAAASNEELEYEIRQLKRLSAFELVRENNIARNKEMLKKLGLDKSFNDVMGLTKSGEKRKAEGSGGRKAKQGRGETEEEDEGENDTPPAPRAARPMRAKPIAQRPPPKEWAKKAKTLLEEKDLGEAWKELVIQWYAHEEKKGFVSPVRIPVHRLPIRRLRVLSITGEGPLGEAASFASRLLGSESQDRNPGDQGHRHVRKGVADVVAGYQSRMA
jgi:hypothetical protein